MDPASLYTDPCGVETWRLGEPELLSATKVVSQRIGELEALRVRMVADIDRRGCAKGSGASSTATWLSGVMRMSPGAATQIVNLSRALTERPESAAALAEARIGVGHAKVIVGFFAHLPDGVPEEALPHCEKYLLDAATTDNPAELARRAAALRHMLEPVEDSVPDAENTALNELFSAVTLGGRGVVRADLDAETMEMLLTALSALSAPDPGADGVPDRRSAARRRADAFTELLRRYLNSGQGPVEGYERPHVSLLISADDLAAAGSHDEKPPNDAQPSAGEARGLKPSFVADRGAYEQMFGEHAAPGWMPWIGPISARAARRISCDCELTAILLDGNGVPLNLGRSQRLVSPQQRRALVARDLGCAFPGCGRPAAWTQAHHIRHWIDGGTTDLANLVLLCGQHHQTVHQNGWDIVIGEDHHPWFLPPEWMDAQRQPRPAHYRQHHPTFDAA